MLTYEEEARCREMCRRLAGDFDGDAAKWLIKHEALAEEFMIGHFDLLSATERMSLYHLWFGLFPRSFRRAIELRLNTERDPECRKELARIEKFYGPAFAQPQRRRSKAERLAELEQGLKDENPMLRWSAAMGIYALTGMTKAAIPVLLEMLRSRNYEPRELAARSLGKLKPLSQEAILELRAIAKDAGDPLRGVAEEALGPKSRILNWLGRHVR
jgi:hypothetical protein